MGARRVALGLIPSLILGCAVALAQERTLQLSPQKPAPAGEKRVALIIGNSAYKDSPLRNPVNDARAMSKALAATGFKVTVLENASEVAMRRAIRTFGDELAGSTVGLFYYAGHGMQVRGRNYLIPVNADIQREDEVEDQALDANVVLAKMDSAKNSLNLMILDACRNNPFARSFRSSARGLAQMDAPSGTLVAFATAPGSVAADGEGDNGLYTKHLLANMTRPGLPIEQLFKEVRIGVGRETNDRQVPWESSSLRGDFYFTAPDRAAAQAARKEEVEKAVAEKLAEQQRQMQAMIREMLAKQRAELEEEMRRRPGGAPVPVASAALQPSPVTPGVDPRLPRPGDEWEYAYKDAMTGNGRALTVKVVAATKDGIMDADNFDRSEAQRAYGSGAELLIVDPIWVFSPYIHLFGAASPGARWSDLPYRGGAFCATVTRCEYSAAVAGVEKVTTRAGTFDTVKVIVDLHSSGGTGLDGHRRAVFWYSEKAKRLVKSRVRTFFGNMPEPEYDLELVRYKLN